MVLKHRKIVKCHKKLKPSELGYGTIDIYFIASLILIIITGEDCAYEEIYTIKFDVRYYSNLDTDLQEMYNKCLEAGDEFEQKEVVSKIYNRMQMKLAE